MGRGRARAARPGFYHRLIELKPLENNKRHRSACDWEIIELVGEQKLERRAAAAIL